MGPIEQAARAECSTLLLNADESWGLFTHRWQQIAERLIPDASDTDLLTEYGALDAHLEDSYTTAIADEIERRGLVISL